MPAHTAARQTFANLARTMRSQYALKLQTCRLSQPIEPLWGQTYRMAEWIFKDDPRLQRRVVSADCTPSQLADEIKAHIPGRHYGPNDED
ncbi:hypothetical protein BVER_05693 [Candidatus Burkholderia verschuerenii]|uniref:Uncharacterized protein n=1 Tax=Candidatus Burkholderia verschuerenii TaxID=242163 RepID=A0A0L0LW90_9BURK|nr:DUF2866 domain-containing protein [Candidatus Burkholderia verschuerenii]KND54114.1 hypothetical protein BVER_05693 [Candidatus Burkholderia verschuerenii]